MGFLYILWLQYLNCETDKFHFRWNSYKENDRKTQRRKEHLQPKLFESATGDQNCLLIDCNITLINKTILKKGFENCSAL